jgi:transposase
MDRDVNAACNILKRGESTDVGLRLLQEAPPL